MLLATKSDVIIQTSPGMGKNTTLSLAVLQTINPVLLACQAVVVLPCSNEAAEELQKVVLDLGQYMKVKCLPCDGKRSLKEDIRSLREGVHVVVGTLERVGHLINQKAIRPHEISIFAYEYAAGEFEIEIHDIIKKLKSYTQLLFLSAITKDDIPEELRTVVRYPAYMVGHEEVRILANARYFYVTLSTDSKLETLLNLYKKLTITRGVIFCRNELEIDQIMKSMERKNHLVSYLHPGLNQEEREEILGKFYSSDFHTLIATDVLMCKDVQQAWFVMSYDLLGEIENRISGSVKEDRSAHKIIVISLVTKGERQRLLPAGRISKIKIEKLQKNPKYLRSLLDPEGKYFDFVAKANDHGKLLSERCDQHILSTFDGILNEKLIQGLLENGVESPTQLQQKAIIPCLNGYDVIIHDHNRANITTTLAIAILQMIDIQLRHCQVLVLSATREAAREIHEVLAKVGKRMEVRCLVFVGGTPIVMDMCALLEYVHIAVGSVGRIMDLIRRKLLILDQVKMFVFDEANTLLWGLQSSRTQEIFQALNSDIQTILASTIDTSRESEQFQRFLRKPRCVLMHNSELSQESTKQFCLSFPKENMTFEDISNLYIKLTIPQCVIFCKRKVKRDHLNQKISIKRFRREDFYESIDSEEREIIIKDFCSVCKHILFSTTLLKGENKRQISVFINFHFVAERNKYFHGASKDRSLLHRGAVVHIDSRKGKSRAQDLGDFFGNSEK